LTRSMACSSGSSVMEFCTERKNGKSRAGYKKSGGKRAVGKADGLLQQQLSDGVLRGRKANNRAGRTSVWRKAGVRRQRARQKQQRTLLEACRVSKSRRENVQPPDAACTALEHQLCATNDGQCLYGSVTCTTVTSHAFHTYCCHQLSATLQPPAHTRKSTATFYPCRHQQRAGCLELVVQHTPPQTNTTADSTAETAQQLAQRTLAGTSSGLAALSWLSSTGCIRSLPLPWQE
jgi:hypothetical protein